MSNKWFIFVVAGVAVLATAIFVTSDIKIPGSGLVASITDTVIDVITDITPIEPAPVEPAPIESVPTESTSTSTEPAPVEPVSTEPTSEEPTGISNFTEILDAVIDSVKNFIEPAPVPIPISPKGVSNLKIFVLTQDALESAVNEWLAVQQNIVVDELKVDDYDGGTYLVVISYHTGGSGNSTTRIKFFKSEGLDNSIEAPVQAFLSSLDSSQTVRSVIPAIGVAGSVFMFIIYE